MDVTFPVTPGRQYKLGTIQLSGNKNVFPVEKLRELIHLQPGQLANAVQADQDVEGLKKLYGTRGYMEVQIRPTPQMDDADSTVNYVFQFQEGSIYKMGDLEIHGLDSKATDRMAAEWTLLPGQTYDSGYPQLFVDSIRRPLPLGPMENLPSAKLLKNRKRWWTSHCTSSPDGERQRLLPFLYYFRVQRRPASFAASNCRTVVKPDTRRNILMSSTPAKLVVALATAFLGAALLLATAPWQPTSPRLLPAR